MKSTFLYSLLAIAGAYLIYLSAGLTIPIPGTDVPQSAQTLSILILSALLPRYYGILSVSLYLLAGLVGIPVFSNSGYGITHLLGPTGGYLLGFLFAAIFIFLIKQWKDFKSFILILVTMLLAHLIIIFFGWLWLSKSMGLSLAYSKGVQPFLIGGIAKSILAGLIVFFSIYRNLLSKKTL